MAENRIFSSLGMMYAPQTVAPQHAQTAGMFAAAMLITGIVTGLTTAKVFPTVVRNLSWWYLCFNAVPHSIRNIPFIKSLC